MISGVLMQMSYLSPTRPFMPCNPNVKTHQYWQYHTIRTCADVGPAMLKDCNWPWVRDFHAYLNILEHILEGWTMIVWWGISDFLLVVQKALMEFYHCYPVWASLAQDYLSIMESSVLGEHAFSQGGITISKCHSCLEGDIVEALQCIKCYATWFAISRGCSIISLGHFSHPYFLVF